MKHLNHISILHLLLIFCSCKTVGQVTQQQSSNFFNDSVVSTGHVGISIYEPATGKYLYNYNAEKNFIPSRYNLFPPRSESKSICVYLSIFFAC